MVMACLILAAVATIGMARLVQAAVAIPRVLWGSPHDRIRDELWDVRLGTSMEAVSRNVPFNPTRTHEGIDYVVWSYDHHPVAGVVPAVVFDRDSRRVIAVHVDARRRRLGPCYPHGGPPEASLD